MLQDKRPVTLMLIAFKAMSTVLLLVVGPIVGIECASIKG